MSIKTVKKNFVEIVALLEANKNKKVESILPDILELVTSKKTTSTVHKNELGEITHIFCWYHKLWEPVEWFGSKASSHSGYNTMCKQGVNTWTKQQTEAKKAKTDLLQRVAAKEVPVEDLQPKLEEIEKSRNVVYPRVDEQGMTKEEFDEFLTIKKTG